MDLEKYLKQYSKSLFQNRWSNPQNWPNPENREFNISWIYAQYPRSHKYGE